MGNEAEKDYKRGGYQIKNSVKEDIEEVNHLLNAIEFLLDDKERCLSKIKKAKKTIEKYISK